MHLRVNHWAQHTAFVSTNRKKHKYATHAVNETACDHDIPFASNNMLLILLFLLVYHLFVICLNLALFMNLYFIYYSHICFSICRQQQIIC